jgi:hypothetical protein
MSSDVAAPAGAAPADPTPRSRRALLAAALGGVVGSVATTLGRPLPTAAATGDSLKLGQTNFAGGNATRLNTTSSGGAFWMTQYGFGSAVKGDSVNGHGGVFTTAHLDRSGLMAQNTASSIGSGAAITADGGSNTGVVATSSIEAGVRGTSSSFHGVIGTSTNQVGVYGSSSINAGVYGVSTSGAGIIGTSSSYNAVEGSSSSGTGVQGTSAGSDGHGVVGSASADSGNAAGIYGGSDFSSAFAGYFAGKVAVTGALSKGGGSFKIDHPLDPERKFLMHSFVESPDMKNVYDGVVTTDGSGRAVVELPDWFDALNDGVRYQLTTIGSFARAMVSAEVAKNRFEITTDAPGVRVSWQVTGIRRDAWAQANRIPIELDKAADERGRYLHPSEHGQPASKGLDHLMRERIAGSRLKLPTRP